MAASDCQPSGGRTRSKSSSFCDVVDENAAMMSAPNDSSSSVSAFDLNRGCSLLLRRTRSCIKHSRSKVDIKIVDGRRRTSFPAVLPSVEEAASGGEETSKAAEERLRLPLTSKASSCEAIRTAVASLYNLDDFWRHKIGEGFFSEVYKVGQYTHRDRKLNCEYGRFIKFI